MDQPGKLTNPARGEPNRENEYFPVSVCAREIGLASQVRPSRLASAYSLSTLRLNLVLTRGIPPAFRHGFDLFTTAIGSVASLSGHPIAFYCRESAGTEPVVLKVVLVIQASPWTNNFRAIQNKV